MGLFSRKKNDFDPRKLYVPEVTYEENLPTTLLKTIGVGSSDVKKVVVTYEEDKVTYFFDSGLLRIVESEQLPLELFQRFYWLDKSNYDETVLTNIASLAQENEIPVFYSKVKNTYPDYVEILNDILYSYSVETIFLHINEEIKNVSLDILLGQAEKIVKDTQYMSIDIRELEKFVNEKNDFEKDRVDQITSSPLDITTLHLKTEDFDCLNDIDRIIYAAAESNSSLEDVKNLSQGFIFANILDRAQELAKIGYISVNDPSYEETIPEDDALPSFLSGSNSEEKEETIEEDLPEIPGAAFSDLEEPDEEEWDYAKPSDSDTDDGDFEYEELNKLETGRTSNILDDFENIVKKCMSDNIQDKETIKNVSELLRKNSALEKETDTIDEEILSAQNTYEEAFHKFQYTAVDKNFNENENITDEKLDEIRSESNDIFQDLYELEFERSIIGKDRKNVLHKIKSMISNFDEGNIQEIIYLIDQKLEAIDSVLNKALHTAKDDEIYSEDAAVEAIKKEEYTLTQTPLFFKLVEEYGNPFEDILSA